MVASAIATYQQAVQQRLEQERTERVAAEVRVIEERKRRGVLLGLAAAVVLLIAGGGGAAWWYQQDHFAREAEATTASTIADREIRNLLLRSAERRDRYDFATARTLLAQAEGRLKVLLAPEELTARLIQSRKDLRVVEDLDAIRFRWLTLNSRGTLNFGHGTGKDGSYAKTFRAYGIDVTGTGSAESKGRLIAGSKVKNVLLAALDDWATWDADLRESIMSVARAADPDPLRRRVRDPATWKKRAAVLELARQVELSSQPPSTYLSLGHRLYFLGERERAADFLKIASLRHPRDFWLHFLIADALSANMDDLKGAIGRFRAAISIRPDSAVAHYNLGLSLQLRKEPKEAELAYRKAIALDPRYIRPRINLGELLSRSGRWDEAEEMLRSAQALDPVSSQVYVDLGTMLTSANRLKEAEEMIRKAIKLDPRLAAAYGALGNILVKVNRTVEAESAYREAIARDPRPSTARRDLGLAAEESWAIQRRRSGISYCNRTQSRLCSRSS